MSDMDPIAELQHEIRDATHELAGTYAFLNGLRLCYERGDYGEPQPYVLAKLRFIEADVQLLHHQLGRHSAEEIAAVEAERERLSMAMRLARNTHQWATEKQWALARLRRCFADMMRVRGDVEELAPASVAIDNLAAALLELEAAEGTLAAEIERE